MSTYFNTGAPYHPGTSMPTNVTGECPHRHRTPEAAERCLLAFDAAVKRGHGGNAYADRHIMVNHEGEATRHVFLADCPMCDR